MPAWYGTGVAMPLAPRVAEARGLLAVTVAVTVDTVVTTSRVVTAIITDEVTATVTGTVTGAVVALTVTVCGTDPRFSGAAMQKDWFTGSRSHGWATDGF